MDVGWRLADVPAMLARARALDPGPRAFDLRADRYTLEPPCPAERVLAVEWMAGARLPEDYRRFLLDVGDGGAGPGYGMLRLGARLRPDETPPDLAHDFLHTAAWNSYVSEVDYFDARWIAGSLPLADYGCAITARLVVRGPARGEVWIDDRGSDNGIYPITPAIAAGLDGDRAVARAREAAGNDRRMTFADWYLDWLGRRLAVGREG